MQSSPLLASATGLQSGARALLSRQGMIPLATEWKFHDGVTHRSSLGMRWVAAPPEGGRGLLTAGGGILGDVQAVERAVERDLRAGGVDLRLAALRKALTGALRSLPGPLNVDSGGSFGGIRHDDDLAVAQMQNAAADGEVLPAVAVADAHVAGSQLRDQWRVVRQHAEVPIDTGRDETVGITLVGDAVMSHDLNVELVGHGNE